MDFVYTFVDFSFKEVAYVVFFSKGVGACSDGEFARDDPGDFSPLPPFSVM
jgi:hypothetical protein